ncbi:hypothetical protein [Pseudomonas sp.]|uniref:hypothetical protein n=1 Tax=Pseudomonas sp. TaxID=306 RepID=UPI0028AED991|nr:hypothetical protein [Pseudomonas sp.]
MYSSEKVSANKHSQVLGGVFPKLGNSVEATLTFLRCFEPQENFERCEATEVAMLRDPYHPAYVRQEANDEEIPANDPIDQTC